MGIELEIILFLIGIAIAYFVIKYVVKSAY